MTTTANPLHALHDLAAWLHSPQNRRDWNTSRLNRQTEAIAQERRTDHIERPSTAAPAEQIAQHREQLADDQARADLAVLGEQFAETTRLRLTVTLADQYEDTDDDLLRARLEDISDTAPKILIDLLLADHLYPGEAYRNANAALAPLLNRKTVMEANSGPAGLAHWRRDLQTAYRVLTQSPTTED